MLQKTLLIIFTLGVMACSVTTLRPVQEIANADAALKAAKVLHADTLSPDLYRTATENFYRARKEYRLKNFDLAKKLALRTIRYAEHAEFDAYLKGGATPEVAAQQKTPEGAAGDPEEAMKKAKELHGAQEEERFKAEKEARELKDKELFKNRGEPSLDEEPTDESTDNADASSEDSKTKKTNESQDSKPDAGDSNE